MCLKQNVYAWASAIEIHFMIIIIIIVLFLPQACSDKLKNEIADFGFPPQFPPEEEEEPPAVKEVEMGKDKSKGKKVCVDVVLVVVSFSSRNTDEAYVPIHAYQPASFSNNEVPLLPCMRVCWRYLCFKEL